jgi:hypothetical protein
MPVIRRAAAPVQRALVSMPDRSDPCADRKSPFATVAEAAAYSKLSQRTVRDLVHRGVFKLVPNPPNPETGIVPEKPWRLLWSEVETYAAAQMREAA